MKMQRRKSGGLNWLPLLVLLGGVLLLTVPAAWTAPAANTYEWNNGRMVERATYSHTTDSTGKAVFYQGRYKLLLTGQIIVHLPGMSQSDAVAWGSQHGLKFVQQLPGNGVFVFEAGAGLNSLNVANQLVASGAAKAAYPNWVRHYRPRATPNDPLFKFQWHLLDTGITSVNGSQTTIPTGNDIDVSTAWNTVTGNGSVVQVVDGAVQITHEDIAPNVVAGLSFNYATNAGDPDPPAGPVQNENDHGTGCLGLAAAKGNNGLGIAGVAFNAGAVGIDLLDNQTDVNSTNAMAINESAITCSSNSWGPPDDDGPDLEAPPLSFLEAQFGAVTSGRNGKGVIFTWACGNGDPEGGGQQDSNQDGFANSRFVISVGASNSNGVKSSYSEQGTNVLVNAPGGDFIGSNQLPVGVITADTIGNGDLASGNATSMNYTDGFIGTSASCPIVAGACALIIQANPSLTWRDVMEIIAHTATQIDAGDSAWQTNAAGLHFNNKYGFGRIDVSAAVALAPSWTLLGPETFVTATSSPNIPIPDNTGSSATDTIAISASGTVETVQVLLDAPHQNWPDLTVTLTSPSGTVSTLNSTFPAPETDAGFNGWIFTSRLHMGESSQGNWTLAITDKITGNTGVFNDWRLVLYGTNLGNAITDPGSIFTPIPQPTPTPSPTPTSAPTSSQPQPKTASQSSSGGGGGCFIATAAYGSYLEPHVMVLRDFRDKVLLTHEWGRKFVDAYYYYSPPIADVIARHAWMRFAARLLLLPLLTAVEHPLLALLGMLCLLYGMAALVIQRLRRRCVAAA